MTHQIRICSVRTLDQAAKIVQAGYTHPQSFADPGSNNTWFRAGTTPLLVQTFPSWGNYARSNPEFDMGHVRLPQWDGGGNTRIYTSLAGYYGYVAIRKQDSSERVEEILRILDYIASPFGTSQYLDIRDQSLVVVDGPSFGSRSFSPLFLGAQVSNVSPLAPEWTTDDARVLWATTNRTHSTLTYRSNHNMSRIFPPRTYADPDLSTYHPEYYPIRDGRTVLPALTATSGWQPRFDLDATAEVGIDHVLAHFADNPELDIFSLAINDGGNSFSDTDLDTSIINSEGYASASESYYRWVNQVVTGVIDRNPDLASKTFPVLAYTYVADPPSFDLHPQIVPMVTVDSGAWVDPVARTRITSRFTSWRDRARRTAWYDYSSGTRYVVPRP